MPKQGDVHVVWDKSSDKWRVEVTGRNRAVGLHDTKQTAVDQARPIARRNASELVVHNKDGQIGKS
jgi:Uncharacterized protein conserved in bacteria (DUF2188)